MINIYDDPICHLMHNIYSWGYYSLQITMLWVVDFFDISPRKKSHTEYK